MVQLPDSELIKLVKEGNEVAFEHLLQRYEPLVAKIARRYHIRGYDVEDFYQVGATAFYQAVLSFEGKETTTFYSYVLSCVRNKIISQCRKQNFKVEYVTDYEDISVVMESRGFYTVEKSEVLEEENDSPLHAYRIELEKLLSGHNPISSLERKCLEGFIEGLSYEEIAVKYNLDVKKVGNALARLRAKVRKRD